MDRLAKAAQEVGNNIEGWNAAEVERNLRALTQPRHKPRVWFWLLPATAALAVASLWWSFTERPMSVATSVGASSTLPETVQVVGLGEIQLLSDDARVNTTDPNDVKLLGGTLRVRLASGIEAASVFAGNVELRGAGATFTVEQRDAQAKVVVHHGTVSVSYAAFRQELKAGESGWFPTDEAVPLTNTKSDAIAKDEAPEAQTSSAAQVHLERKTKRAALTPSQLITQADQARSSGDTARAKRLYARFLELHGSGARAGRAAFVLGRMHMGEGALNSAAVYFRRSQQLAPGSALAQDALAREIEALLRAGSKTRALKRIGEYKARYPSGRWLQAVKRYEQQAKQKSASSG